MLSITRHRHVHSTRDPNHAIRLGGRSCLSSLASSFPSPVPFRLTLLLSPPRTYFDVYPPPYLVATCERTAPSSGLACCHVPSFNKYIAVASRATRSALKEEARVNADKRGVVTLKWQTWKDGKGSAQVSHLFRGATILAPTRLGLTLGLPCLHQEWVVPPAEEASK